MRLRREARILKGKALSSLRTAAIAFNAYADDGRTTSVLLHSQHAFEMLLKASLVQANLRVFDEKSGRSLPIEQCMKLAETKLKLQPSEAGVIRTLHELRNQEQHWWVAMSEGLLYAHIRATMTAFDDILERIFQEKVADHLPTRVLPISTELPTDIQMLIDSEYKQIRELLAPGHRRQPEARARIRALLAMEGHVVDEVGVSQHDVERVQAAIRAGKKRGAVFPRLSTLSADVEGRGLTIIVRFNKNAGAPVTFVPADDPALAAGIREIDLQKKYYMSAPDLARKLNLTGPKAFALRKHLKIDDDADCRYVFKFGKSLHPQYSDNAFTKMKAALASADLEAIWKSHAPGKPVVSGRVAAVQAAHLGAMAAPGK